MTEFRRRLPHIYPDGAWLFLTWHLAGSLPPALFPPPSKRGGEAFLWMDRYLDGARSGPTHLRQPGVAAIVVESIQTGARLRHYELGPWVVMLNHVHLLIRPQIDASRLLQSLKGGSARRASQLLGLTGQRFWQEESYDHVVHDEKTFRRIANYIEDNPVRAGLCETPAEFAWSSAAVSAGADD